MTIANDMRDLLKILPKGNWKIIEDPNTDPTEMISSNDSVVIKVKGNELVQERITYTFLFNLLNSIEDILLNLDTEKSNTIGLYKEIKHLKETRMEAYDRGVSDAYNRCVDAEVRTPTAKDALLEASARILGLLEK